MHYCDNFLLVYTDKGILHEAGWDAVRALVEAGFLISPKSVLEPVVLVSFLGKALNLSTRTVECPTQALLQLWVGWRGRSSLTSSPPPSSASSVACAPGLTATSAAVAASIPSVASFGHGHWKTRRASFPGNTRLTSHHASRLDMTPLECQRARVRRRVAASPDL